MARQHSVHIILEHQHDAAGFVQAERTAASAAGALHVHGHHPATRVYAPAIRSSTAVPFWTRTVKRPTTYFSSRG